MCAKQEYTRGIAVGIANKSMTRTDTLLTQIKRVKQGACQRKHEEERESASKRGWSAKLKERGKTRSLSSYRSEVQA